MDDLDGLRADLQTKQRAYYDALDTYHATTRDAWAHVGGGGRAEIRDAMRAAHEAYIAAQRHLDAVIEDRRDRRTGADTGS